MRLSRNMFTQNFIKLSAMVQELLGAQGKNSNENITVRSLLCGQQVTKHYLKRCTPKSRVQDACMQYFEFNSDVPIYLPYSKVQLPRL